MFFNRQVEQIVIQRANVCIYIHDRIESDERRTSSIFLSLILMFLEIPKLGFV